MSPPADPAKVQRELRLGIARSRRRIDAQLREAKVRGVGLVAWRYPLNPLLHHRAGLLSVAAAVGAVLLMAGYRRRGRGRGGRRGLTASLRWNARLARRLVARFARRTIARFAEEALSPEAAGKAGNHAPG